MPKLQGQKADRLVTRIDPGVVSLLAELRGHERPDAEELGPVEDAHQCGGAVPRAVRLQTVPGQY